jgi:hypothetical protein
MYVFKHRINKNHRYYYLYLSKKTNLSTGKKEVRILGSFRKRDFAYDQQAKKTAGLYTKSGKAIVVYDKAPVRAIYRKSITKEHIISRIKLGERSKYGKFYEYSLNRPLRADINAPSLRGYKVRLLLTILFYKRKKAGGMIKKTVDGISKPRYYPFEKKIMIEEAFNNAYVQLDFSPDGYHIIGREFIYYFKD